MNTPINTPMSVRITRLQAVCALCAAMVVSAGCSRPQTPDPETPPEPQATQLRDAIQQPLDQAEAVKQATEDAAKAQRATIDEATGG